MTYSFFLLSDLMFKCKWWCHFNVFLNIGMITELSHLVRYDLIFFNKYTQQWSLIQKNESKLICI